VQRRTVNSVELSGAKFLIQKTTRSQQLAEETKSREDSMNKDRVQGKAKDIAGRVERQVGEWTGDAGKQVKGAAKQAEGKVQNAWGQAKDATKKQSDDKPKVPQRPMNDPEAEEEQEESEGLRTSRK
jgi:uncharacterized protein YjbJ (UPF0337 family)